MPTQGPYQTFNKSLALDQKLKRKAVAKSVDIPWDEEEMRITNIRKGVPGWLAALLATLGVGGTLGGGLLAYNLIKPIVGQPTNPPDKPPPSGSFEDTNTKYKIVPMQGE